MAFIASLICAQHIVLAAESDWSAKADLQALYGSYSGALSRKSIASGGLILSADYLELGGFALGSSYTKLAFRNGTTDINQQSYYASLHYNLYLDVLPGPITLRLDGHAINNNDTSGNTDNVRVVAPQLSFLNYNKTFYADFGYAYSIYQNNLKIHQFTPTLGFGFNDSADWVRLRGYVIAPSNALRAQNKSSTSALEAQWTHWFAPDAWHKLNNIKISGLVGERIYAVDNDAATVYNLTDVQRGSVSLALQWKLTQAVSLMLMAGNENYLNNTTADSYNNRYGYLNLSSQW
ncbi:hypothetical protein D8Y20_09600 [Mariprofundus sp. EBB-1]|nr:hypothetical protein D8Y20_09600 [Mariprofundus sp. EBB-1]